MTISRRGFVGGVCAAAAGISGMEVVGAPPMKTRLLKAMILKQIEEPAMKKLKDAGFHGVECSTVVTVEQAKAGREIAEKLGMKVHSVMRGWGEFNADPSKAEASLVVTQDAIRAAAAFGAQTVLLVPCRVKTTPMPEAWEYELSFDEKTGHVKQVVKGDNSKYQPYIEAHNHAIDMSTAAMKKLIPLAEQCNITIALENVWNNLWVKPAHARQFVSSFNHPLVKAYFDIGNHVKYAPPQDWIKTLGSLIVRCHVKDFQLNPDGHGGKFVHPRDGSINWPSVRQALEQVGYNGWLTIEDGGLSLEEFSKRLDQIIAGE